MAQMKETWDTRINRAERLAAEIPESRELLVFYSALLRCQKEIYEYLRTRKDWLPSGELARDLSVLRRVWPNLLHTVETNGPPVLVSEARQLLDAKDDEVTEMLIGQWHAPLDSQFFEKAFLQPYVGWLREIGAKPLDRNLGSADNRCPFCSGKPQVTVLQIKEPSSESGGRDLICATCLSAWPFRRVACANCGEEHPTKIGYYHSSNYDHVRVEVCETCKHYIKGIDLTKYGLAIPVVDEVAAAPLDLWARERGYSKIEMNLVGL